MKVVAAVLLGLILGVLMRDHYVNNSTISSGDTLPGTQAIDKEAAPAQSKRKYQPNIDENTAQYVGHTYFSMASAEASPRDLDADLICAMIIVESSGDSSVTNKDHYGLMQIKLSTARKYYPNITPRQLLIPRTNIEIGCRHLEWLRSELLREYPSLSSKPQRLSVAMTAAYNAGEHAILNAIESEYPTNHEHVAKVWKYLSYYKFHHVKKNEVLATTTTS